MSTPALAPAPAPLLRHRAVRSTHGLTLLELLVALTIMALSLGVLYRASGSGARNAGELYEHQRALLLLVGRYQLPQRLFLLGRPVERHDGLSFCHENGSSLFPSGIVPLYCQLPAPSFDKDTHLGGENLC